MVANKRNAPHPRRKSIKKTSQKGNSIIAERKSLFIDKENDTFTPAGEVLFLLITIVVITQGTILLLPFTWLGVL